MTDTSTVTVKPLVWSSAGIWGNQPAYYADSAMGWVQIVDHRQHGNGFRVYPAWEESDEGNYEDLEAAKAAAQADYERRIRSALEPQTPAQAARVLLPIFEKRHISWAQSKARNPEDYTSQHSATADALRAIAGGE